MRRLFTIALVAAASLAAFAQDKANAGKDAPPTLRSQTRLVTIPVLVRDEQNQHVSGLKAEDFEVTENGKAQKVTVFEEVAPPSPPGPTTAAALPRRAPQKPNEFTNVITGSLPRLRIIALDAINSGILDQARSRKAMIDFLAKSMEANVATALIVMSRNHTRLVYDFTQDPALLVKAIQNVRAKVGEKDLQSLASSSPDSPRSEAAAARRENFGSVDQDVGASMVEKDLRSFITERDDFEKQDLNRRILATLESFEHLGMAFQSIPGRKELIWVTAGLPFSLNNPAESEDQPIAPYFDRAFNALNAGNVAVYPVDLKGLLVQLFPDISQCTTCGRTLSSNMPTSARGTAVLPGAVSSPNLETRSGNSTTLTTVAELTGGRAFYNTNEIESSFNKVDLDAGGYYLLNYYVPAGATPGWKKLKVRARGGDYKVRARSGYMLTAAGGEAARSRTLDLQAAAASPLQYVAVPIHLELGTEFPAAEAGRQASFVINVPAGAIDIDRNNNNAIDCDFFVLVRDQKNDLVGQMQQPLKGNLQPRDLQQIVAKGITYRNKMALPPGEYSMRVIVRDNLTGRIGTVFAPLTVP